MALDPRIALQAIGIQAPDVLGAMRQGQEYRQNQMAQQAAQATAQRNMMARQRAAAVDPTNRPQVNAFVNEVGADVAAPYLEAWNNVGGMFRAEAEEGRAARKFGTDQSEAYMTQLPRFAAQLLGDASPANVARVRAQADASGFPVAVYDALATRLADLPPEQQQQAIQSYLLTTGGGETAVKALYPARELVNTGATQVPVNLSPLARDPASGAPVPVTGALRNTPDPRAPQIFSSSQGVGQIGSDGTFTPVTDAGGAPVMPYVAPRAVPATDALGAQAASADTLRDVLGQLRTNFDVLYQNGFMRGGGVSPVGNLAQFVGDLVPGVRGARLSTNSAADTASGNVEALLSTAISTLSALYGTSSRVMDAVKEMENARSTFGGQNLTIEAARNMVDTALRRVDELEASRVDGGGGGSGGGQVAYDAQGNRFVVRNGQWVRE
jgi:hypothetical protein